MTAKPSRPRRGSAWVGLFAAGCGAISGYAAESAAGDAAPSAYIWPLDAPPVLTSSFGEFRESHLHAGIDLGTGGRNGLRCFAVGDGWIARLRMSPFGYGKAVYLQLDSGPLVVYAHLSRFAPELAARARHEQFERKAYTFDAYLRQDEIRVRRGDVIAWSGDTGVGFPHLHFEVRNGDVAVNPQGAGFPLRDALAPTIRDVAIMPLNAAARVDDGLDVRVLDAAAPPRPVRVSGHIGFAVRAFDQAAKGTYRQSPYRHEVRVGGTLLYRAVYDRFDYAHNHHIVLEYDQERLHRKDERAFLLFERDGNELPGRESTGSGGVLHAGTPAAGAADSRPGRPIAIPPGTHEVVVEVADVAGGTERVRFEIDVGTPPQVLQLDAVPDGESWNIRCDARDADGDSLTLALAVSRDAGATWQTIATGAAESTGAATRWTAGWTQATAPPAGAGPAPVIRARVHDPSGRADLRTRTLGVPQAAASVQAGTASRLDATPRWGYGRLQLTIEASTLLAAPPSVQLLGPDGSARRQLGVQQTGDRAWLWARDLDSLGDAVEHLEVSGISVYGESLRTRLPVRARILRPGVARRVDDLDPSWRFEIGSETLFEPVALRMRPFDPAKLPLGTELVPAGACVELESRTTAVNARIPVRYDGTRHDATAPTGSNGDSVAEPANARTGAGLFYVDRGGRVKFLSADRDASGALVGKLPYFTIVAVLADNTPPRLSGFARSGGTIRFRVEDGGADLSDSAVHVEIDGEFALPEWDPETGTVIVHPAADLTAGTHVLRVVAVDRVQNRAEREWTFQVP